MKDGDIVRSREGFMIGRVVITETECAICSLEDDDNRWIVRASHVSQFKKYWKVVSASEE
ncbi:hypothetical protein KJK41_22180 (plasmid) [Bacillus haikouensis]|jgi:hypothetical protein|nr:hypothetical protein KJK41_22180 [Bacillus haikouensis]